MGYIWGNMARMCIIVAPCLNCLFKSDDKCEIRFSDATRTHTLTSNNDCAVLTRGVALIVELI